MGHIFFLSSISEHCLCGELLQHLFYCFQTHTTLKAGILSFHYFTFSYAPSVKQDQVERVLS